ncbi:MAG: polysaccharide deacetylase family protein, partial [candidate division WOR-3 bacterium]
AQPRAPRLVTPGYASNEQLTTNNSRPSLRSNSGPDLSEHTVVLVFDDGWQSVFTTAFPLLRDHRIPVVLGLISGAVRGGKLRYAGTSEGYMNQAEIREIMSQIPVEIASHTKTHPYLTRLTDDSVLAELSDSKQSLEQMFGTRVITLVYPYGDQNPRIQRLTAQAGYSLARSIRPGRIDFDRRPYELPATEVRNTTSLEFIRKRVIENSTLILFFHRIVPRPRVFTEWSTAQFAEFLDWLDENQVRVLTLSDLYARHQGRPIVGPLLRRNWRTRVEWDLLEQVNVNVTWTAQGR